MKSELRYYFIRLTIFKKVNMLDGRRSVVIMPAVTDLIALQKNFPLVNDISGEGEICKSFAKFTNGVLILM